MVRTKVFVGNLHFQTKEAELVKEFSTAGKVISANIITRGPRSLGYGFVEMDSEEDARKAVAAMDKKEIDGRPINVEVAKPREETEQKEGSPSASPSNTRGGRGGPRGGAPRGGRGGAPRGGAPRGGRGGPRGGGGAPQQREFRPRGFSGGRGGAQNQERRPQAESKEEENRTPSKTTLFVANLPFKLDDEEFGKVLKESSLVYKSAHVVRNQRSGRSKGFGFIEFDNESDQQKALAALNNKKVEERELVVKVALTENKTEAAPATEAAKKQ